LKLSRTAIVLLVIVVIVVAAAAALLLLQGPGNPCNSTWNCAATYPLQGAGTYGVAGVQCVADSPYVYCMGGVDSTGLPHDETYYGAASQSGNITAWTLGSNPYPKEVSGEACVTSSGYVYCVGGFIDASADDTGSSYYAQLSGTGGIGTWFYATPYPVTVDSMSCVASSSRIYCVGGNNETDSTDGTMAPSDTAWYAGLSATGIGAWNRTASYPNIVALPSCAEWGGYIYCVGGADSNSNPLSNAFYASLTAQGIGQWIPTTGYPLPATGQSCATSGGYIYCVGGATTGGQTASYTNAVYYAPVSASGIGTWKEATDYPNTVGTSCAVSFRYIYCVGGFDSSVEGENDAVNYASLATLGS
jgi:hypothetical protein